MDDEAIIIQDLRGLLYLNQSRIIGCMAVFWGVAMVLSTFDGSVPQTDSPLSSLFKFVFESSGGLFLLILVYVISALRLCRSLGRYMGGYEGVFGTLFFVLITTVLIVLAALSHSSLLYVWLG